MKNKILYIDIAKAICIILVVIGHYVPNGCPKWWMLIHDIIYSFHMPLFMFASGFVYIATFKENQSYGTFLLKKFKRLMIPYLTVSFLVISVKLLTESHLYVENPKSFMSYIKMFYYPEAGYFLWFIWALWWMFVIVPLFKNKNSRLLLFVVSIILAYIPIYITEIFCLAQFKSMLIYFMLGVITYDWKDIFAYGKKIPTIGYISLFSILFALRIFNEWGGLRIINMVLPLVGIAFIISLSMYLDRKNFSKKWLLLVSSSSYIIYLFHTTFQGFAKAVVFKTPCLNNINNDITFSIGAIIVVSCGVVIPILLNGLVFKRHYITRILFGLK